MAASQIQSLQGWQESIHRKTNAKSAFFISVFVASTIAYGFALFNPELLHWFLIPTILCGGLIGVDLVRWIAGETDIFDPVGLLSAVGAHFFFLVPLLQVMMDTKLAYVIDQPADYRPWIGLMSCINFVGLLCYRLALHIFGGQERRLKSVWILKGSLFLPVLATALLISAGAELYVLHSFGGFGGVLTSFTEKQDKFNNTGWLFMLSESFPTLIMIGVAGLCWKKRITWYLLGPLLAFVIALEFILGGLRGSRQNVIWAVVWALGIIHYGIRPISRRTIGACTILMLAFMYFYGFYKVTGAEAFSRITDSEWRSQVVDESGRSFESVLVQDLGRSDVQSFALYRIQDWNEYAWGRTYLGAFNLLIPRWISNDRLPTKVKWTTDLEYGAGSYDSNHYPSSRVYGLAGEAMLNFGIIGVPIAYGLFGYLMAKMRMLSTAVDKGDGRILMVPFLACLAMVMLAHDLDVDLFIAVKNAMLPFAVIYLGSTRVSHRRVARVSNV
jgi:hypothetical protein